MLHTVSQSNCCFPFLCLCDVMNHTVILLVSSALQKNLALNYFYKFFAFALLQLSFVPYRSSASLACPAGLIRFKMAPISCRKCGNLVSARNYNKVTSMGRKVALDPAFARCSMRFGPIFGTSHCVVFHCQSRSSLSAAMAVINQIAPKRPPSGPSGHCPPCGRNDNETRRFWVFIAFVTQHQT